MIKVIDNLYRELLCGIGLCNVRDGEIINSKVIECKHCGRHIDTDKTHKN